MSRVDHVVVIGATGDVGRGVVGVARARGWAVTVVARHDRELQELAEETGSTALVGSVATLEDATRVVEAAQIRPTTSVVNAIHRQWAPQQLIEARTTDVTDHLAAYVGAHHAAARAFLPRLDTTATYLGVGGGTADFVRPSQAPGSMAQAAQRMLYRGLAKETAVGPYVREVLVAAMVNGRRTREVATVEWITEREVGDRVCEVLAAPTEDANAGPILTLRSPRG